MSGDLINKPVVKKLIFNSREKLSRNKKKAAYLYEEF
jgi:hypothetical protein